MSALRDLSTDFSVLSVYGLEDRIIPVNDGSFYANVLNRGPYSHHLELIPFADHNFYGIDPIETEDDAEDYNPHNLPLNNKKLVNHNVMVTSIIIDYLKPENELNRFLYRSFNVGYIPRWKQLDGISDFTISGPGKFKALLIAYQIMTMKHITMSNHISLFAVQIQPMLHKWA